MSHPQHISDWGHKPEPEGYDLVLDTITGRPYDPLKDGTRVYACGECAANWNAGERHLRSCSRRFLWVT